MHTDLCLFYSVVLPARSHGERDMYFSTVVVRMLRERVAAVDFTLTLLGLLKHNPLQWRLLMCLCTSRFWQSYTTGVKNKQKNKKLVWFHNDLHSQNEMREGKQRKAAKQRSNLCQNE